MSTDLPYIRCHQGNPGDLISPDEFERAVAELLPSMQDSGSKPLEDSVFPRITRLLELVGKQVWSLRPRTYTILRMINRVDVMNSFVVEGLYDISLPFSKRTLPDTLKSPAARMKFLELQPLVISSQAATVESGQGRHRHFIGDGDVHFKRFKQLGIGGFGEVDHVWSRLGHNEFARKRIPRGKTFKKDKLAMLDFERELGALKRLSHHHLVKYIGSYTDPKYVAIIMSPVANSNLKEFLTLNPFPPERLFCLRQFFGCLASALAYLHENQIRHKDVKPSNILIYGDTVLITDFGTALNWTDQGHSTTSSTLTTAITRAYCSPEVFNLDRRNSSSDIYSLGCVFLEMTTVLRGRTLGSMKEYFSSHGTNESHIRTNRQAMDLWLEEIRDTTSPGYDNQPFEWIKGMVEVRPENRPSARELFGQIYDSEGGFCGTCCAGGDSSADSSYQGSIPDEETTPAAEVEGIHGYTPQPHATDVNDIDVTAARSPEEQATIKWQGKQPQSLVDRMELVHLQRAATSDTAPRRTFQQETAAQLLLRGGFDIEARDFNEHKALHWAAANGYSSVVQLLLQNGTHRETYFDFEEGPLEIAAKFGHTEVVSVLLAPKANVNAPTDAIVLHSPIPAASSLRYSSGMALQLASELGHLEVVGMILFAGTDVNATHDVGGNALQAASRGGHLKIVERLLAAGARVNATDNYGKTALQAASGSGHLNIVERLLAAGFHVNAADGTGKTALQAASRSGHLKVVERLLAAGANVNMTATPSIFCTTALQAAAEFGHTDVVEKLLAAGADARATDGSRGTALELAQMGNHIQVIKLLKSTTKPPAIRTIGSRSQYERAEGDVENTGIGGVQWSASRKRWLP